MSTLTLTSIRRQAGAAGFFWLMTILAGAAALLAPPQFGLAANLTADASYIAASLLVYGLLAPVSRPLSAVAAFCGVSGCVMGLLAMLLEAPRLGEGAFIYFGLHCLLVGLLILGSTFLPRFLGVLMGIGGLGWLTLAFSNLLAPAFADVLAPWILFPGILGESALTFWLLAVGVNVQRWHRQADTTLQDLPVVRTLASIPL